MNYKEFDQPDMNQDYALLNCGEEEIRELDGGFSVRPELETLDQEERLSNVVKLIRVPEIIVK